jgi:hypothetical protein
MKHTALVFLLGLFISCTITAQSIQINDHTIIKDPKGNDVALTDFMTMMDSKEYCLEPKIAVDGTNYIQLIKLSAEEQKMMLLSRVPKKNDFKWQQPPLF